MLQSKLIDYRLLADAVDFYATHGYKQIEVPWVVPEYTSLLTSPSGDTGYAFPLIDGSHMVCSAEQGFIQRHLDGNLPAGKLFSVSPCFRNETLDETHSKWFVKLELFSAHIANYIAAIHAGEFAIDAQKFHRRMGIPTKFIATDIGRDMMYGDLELGSYGTRCINGEYIAYGTGLALPRAQLAREKEEWDII